MMMKEIYKQWNEYFVVYENWRASIKYLRQEDMIYFVPVKEVKNLDELHMEHKLTHAA
jgi:hypothetical protein